jgi:hypothetical protein
MHTIIQAVVLRSLDGYGLRYSVYTSEYGRLDIQDIRRGRERSPLVIGDVGYVVLVQQGKRWALDSFESMIARSEAGHTESFYWRHHFLDMYFYYVPLEQPSTELFGLLLFVLQLAVAPVLVFKLCAARFFSLLGYYVPEALLWYKGVLQGVDEFMQQNSANDVLRFEIKEEYILRSIELDAWLVDVVVQHDHFKYLKTQHFLPQLYGRQGKSV